MIIMIGLECFLACAALWCCAHCIIFHYFIVVIIIIIIIIVIIIMIGLECFLACAAIWCCPQEATVSFSLRQRTYKEMRIDISCTFLYFCNCILYLVFVFAFLYFYLHFEKYDVLFIQTSQATASLSLSEKFFKEMCIHDPIKT